MKESDFPRNLEAKEQSLFNELHGVIIPLVTPLLAGPKTPMVDVGSYSNLIRSVLPHVNALFTTGNAGEGSHLDFQNWKEITKSAVEIRDQFAKRTTPVISGVLRSNPDEVARFSFEAERIGVDGLVVAPMYGGQPEKVLSAALRSSRLPIILYNNPNLSSGLELPLDFVGQVVDNFTRIVGIKSSSTDFEVFKKTLLMKSDTFRVFQGNTADAALSLKLGADGIVPAEAAINPILFANLYQVFLSRNLLTQDRMRDGVSSFLMEVRDRKLALNMETACYIKRVLQTRKIFQSSRMYEL